MNTSEDTQPGADAQGLKMEALGGLEPPTNGLGNRCSIHLSYRARCFLNQ